MPQRAHALGELVEERLFAAREVSGAGDVEPHRVGWAPAAGSRRPSAAVGANAIATSAMPPSAASSSP